MTETTRRCTRAALPVLVVCWLAWPLAPVAQAAGASAVPATPAMPGMPGRAASAAKGPRMPVVQLDVNSASRAQLKTLRGIGDAEVDKIIAGRPYLSKAELVTKGALPAGVYQVIRHDIVARQKSPAAGKN